MQSGDTPPEVYAEIRARLARGESWQGVFRNRRKDGGSYWAETTIVPLRGPEGEVRNFIGIAEDITEKRAAREQVARAQKLEAVGLLVEEMGGSIAVESQPGEGAEFRLILPGVSTVAAMAEAETEDLPRGRERLVLVDDEPEVAATYRRVLLRLGYQVEAFTSPKIALDHVRAGPRRPDLLITDMVMPDLNGEELAAALRELRPDLPVIVCSGYAPAGIALTGPKPVVLDKPVDPVALAKRVRAMLDATNVASPA
ncbi:MAG: response regulator [Kiloniellales bacterium]|nr:response regulator [Kiloniellales bacterium]